MALPQIRVPTKLKPSAAKSLKSRHSKMASGMSLKSYARELLNETTEVVCSIPQENRANVVNSWFFNKRANPSKPPLKIGSTRKKKKNVQQKKA